MASFPEISHHGGINAGNIALSRVLEFSVLFSKTYVERLKCFFLAINTGERQRCELQMSEGCGQSKVSFRAVDLP